ncbi:MAG TPA: hypothetical protein VIF62_27025 [Labilithrix sp.]|jgi:hypothetical protein
MGINVASLLLHDEAIPAAARAALDAAREAPPDSRVQLLESAARILHYDVGVPCADARELVDLDPRRCDE